jgi:hypothetical protein
MGFLERVEVAIDVVTDKATSGIQGLKGAVNDAEGAAGKLKAGASSLSSTLSDNMGAAVASVGAGIVAFGIKSVQSFETLALSVDKFQQATGASADQSSRWIKVADDLGVGADTVQAAMGRVNREAASGALVKYGVTAKDASTQFQQLLTHLAGIPDKDQQAAEAFKTLGKSWQSLSPLLDTTVNLKDRLAEVSGSEIITPEQIKQARDLRDAMNKAEDEIKQITLTIGGKLAPVVTGAITDVEELGHVLGNINLGPLGSAADFLGNLLFKYNGITVISTALDAFNTSAANAGGASDDLAKALTGVTDKSKATADNTTIAATATQGLSDNSQILNQHLQDRIGNTTGVVSATDAATQSDIAYASQVKFTNDQLAAQALALNAARTALDAKTQAGLAALNTDLAYDQAIQGVSNSLSTFQQDTLKAADAVKQHGEKSTEAAAASRQLDNDSLSLQSSVLQVAAAAQAAADKQGELAGHTLTAQENVDAQKQALEQLKQKFPELSGGIDAYIQKLNQIPTHITTTVVVQQSGQVNLGGPNNNAPIATASGGPRKAGSLLLVGEEGPELMVPGQDSTFLTASQTSAVLGGAGTPVGGGGGGDTYNVTLNVTSASPDQVIAAVEQWKRRNGKRPWMAA